MSILTIHPEQEPQSAAVAWDFDAIADYLRGLGVGFENFERWAVGREFAADADRETVLSAYAKPLEWLKALYGFQSADVISVGPAHPQKAQLRASFLKEHRHSDFEARFFVKGRGLFYLHPDEHVYAVLCEKGDLIALPAHFRHWFDMGGTPDLQCIRLFTTPTGWAADFTGSDIAEKFPGIERFVEEYAGSRLTPNGLQLRPPIWSSTPMSILTIHSDQGHRPAAAVRDFDAIADCLRGLGVSFERWTAEREFSSDADQDAVLLAYAGPVARLKALYGFQSADVISVGPEHPQKEQLRAKFLSEHTHSDFEVRFFVEGRGLFYLHPDENVYAVLCERGDLISVPAHVKHWFDMGADPELKCIRLFTTPEGWVADFTGSDIAGKFPTIEKFIEEYA